MMPKKNKDDELKKRFQKVEKDIEKTVNKNKKNIFKIAMIISLITISILALGFFFGIKISFIISDSPQIAFSPLQKSLHLSHEEKEVVEFKVANENNVCKIECEYRLIDYSRNRTLVKNSTIIDTNKVFSKQFLFNGDIPSSGQRVYNFQIACHNIKSLICDTKEEDIYKSSFVTLNYHLTEKEKNIKSALEGRFSDYFRRLREADLIIKQDMMMKRVVMDRSGEVFDIREDDKFLRSKQKAERLIELWAKEDYYELDASFTEDDVEELNDLVSRLNEENENTIMLIRLFNDNINMLDRLIENQSMLEPYYDHYCRINRTEHITDYMISLNNTRNELEDKSYRSIKNMNSMIANLSDDFKQIISLGNYQTNYTYNIGKKNIMNFTESKNISFNISAKSIDDNCEIIDRLDNKTDMTNSSVAANISEDLYDYKKRYCGNQSYKLPLKVRDLTLSKIDANQTISSNLSLGLPENNPRCCILDRCSDCCEDCSDKDYPTIFVHGHAFRKSSSPEQSVNRFAEFQVRMQKAGFINAGQIDLRSGEEEIPYADWGKQKAPVTLVGSFYYIRYYDLGKYTITTEKTEGIENYAIRLKEIIDLAKFRTGKDKVNIVAHSMGGLIARQYISLFGEQGVDKLILIATPNKGITPDIKKFCVIAGSKKECEEMAEGSIFMKRINDPRKIPKSIGVYNIIATGCDMDGKEGDGIVLKGNAALDYAKNIHIEGDCTDFLNTNLHNNIINYNRTYEKIVEVLKEN